VPDESSVYRERAYAGPTRRRSAWISFDLPDGTLPAVPGGPTDHHITVVYLGRISDEEYSIALSRAQSAAAVTPRELVGVVSGVDSFEPSEGSGGKTPAFAPVELPGIEALRAALADLSASEHSDYRPHVTVAYLGDGEPLPAPVLPTRVTFTHLALHRGSERVLFQLGQV
jgi:2'-5' RNA ligase